MTRSDTRLIRAGVVVLLAVAVVSCAKLAPYHPFLVSGEMPLDTGATLPISVVMLGASAPSRCGMQVAVPVQRTGGAHTGDSLLVSISAVRDGEEC